MLVTECLIMLFFTCHQETDKHCAFVIFMVFFLDALWIYSRAR